MRRQLIAVFVAVSTMVAVAFVVPLGFLIRRTAEDRAIDAARADSAAVVPALVADGNRGQIESAVGATGSGQAGRMTVITPQGWVIGPPVESARLDEALQFGTSAIGTIEATGTRATDARVNDAETTDAGATDAGTAGKLGAAGGVEVITAVATGPGALSAIRVEVPSDDLRRGQWRAWLTLASVGFTLVGISVLIADRLARSVVRPTVELADAARRLGDGDLGVTVDPEGPPELVDLATSFNRLGSRVGDMLDRERGLVAELSHRLRTPLTKLRMRVDQVDDPRLAQELTGDIEDLTAEVNRLIGEARGVLGQVGLSDAGAVVGARAEFWQVLAEDQNRPYHFEIDQGPLPVAVGAEELAAAVDTLLQNVFAHTDEGVPLAVGLRREGPRVRIWVEDGGPGIRPADVEAGVSSMGSTGLGLAIARRTAESAGGTFEIATGQLGGASVILLLPLTPPEIANLTHRQGG